MAAPATAQRWIWLDMEMSGLDPDRDRVLEIAMAITDTHLEVVAEAPVLVIHQTDEVLAGMDEWNQKTHARTGLIDKVRASALTEAQAEAQLLAFLTPLVMKKSSPMCGNSICQDRRFMARHLPALEDYFHYRNLDVSTPKELAKAWRPDVAREIAALKTSRHEALADVYESIAELKVYRDLFFRLDLP